MKIKTLYVAFFLALIFGVFFLSTSDTFAAGTPCDTSKQPSEGIAGIDFLEFNKAIIPCGRKCDDTRTAAYDETLHCTLCHLLIMIKNVVDLLFAWLIIVSLIFITISGVTYIVSTGNPGLKTKAKGMITKTLTGFAVFLLSWLIVYTALAFFSAANVWGISAGDKWYEFTCDETSSPFEGVTTYTAPTPATGSPGAEPATASGYTYDPGIAAQMSDASPALVSFLNCLQTKLPDDAKKISSISDSAGMALCSSASYSRPPCAHSQYSCHYGGMNCIGQSYAVDFGNETYYAQIRASAKECESDAYVLFEGNHVHVSIGAANGCGCN